MTNTITAVAIAGLTGGGIVATSAITGETQVPLSVVAGSFIFVGGFIWTAGRFMQRILDEIRELKKDIKSLPCRMPVQPGKHKCVDKETRKWLKLRGMFFGEPSEETTTT